MSGEPMVLCGTGTARREVLYVDDCTDACVHLTNPKACRAGVDRTGDAQGRKSGPKDGIASEQGRVPPPDGAGQRVPGIGPGIAGAAPGAPAPPIICCCCI